MENRGACWVNIVLGSAVLILIFGGYILAWRGVKIYPPPLIINFVLIALGILGILIGAMGLKKKKTLLPG